MTTVTKRKGFSYIPASEGRQVRDDAHDAAEVIKISLNGSAILVNHGGLRRLE